MSLKQLGRSVRFAVAPLISALLILGSGAMAAAQTTTMPVVINAGAGDLTCVVTTKIVKAEDDGNGGWTLTDASLNPFNLVYDVLWPTDQFFTFELFAEADLGTGHGATCNINIKNSAFVKGTETLLPPNALYGYGLFGWVDDVYMGGHLGTPAIPAPGVGYFPVAGDGLTFDLYDPFATFGWPTLFEPTVSLDALFFMAVSTQGIVQSASPGVYTSTITFTLETGPA